MPTTRRSPTRPGAGPGRGTRHRTGTVRNRRDTVRPELERDTGADEALDRSSERPDQEVGSGALPSVAETRRREVARRRSSITTRAIAFAVVALVLIISYASSLRIYLSQRHEIATTQAEIAQRQTEIAELQTDVDRWNDPAYVKTQARARLGWVLPGETGYRVLGADGTVIGGTESVGGSSDVTVPSTPTAWWQNLFGAVKKADADPNTTPQPTRQPTITESTKPKN